MKVSNTFITCIICIITHMHASVLAGALVEVNSVAGSLIAGYRPIVNYS